jgi:hypothetical protein
MLRTLPAALAALALLLVVPLALWNLVPARFPAGAHDALGALPLALVAVGYLWHRLSARPSRRQAIQAAMLAAGFGLWSATQVWPQWRYALVLNDLAIGLFVSELFLTITARPAGPVTR